MLSSLPKQNLLSKANPLSPLFITSPKPSFETLSDYLFYVDLQIQTFSRILSYAIPQQISSLVTSKASLESVQALQQDLSSAIEFKANSHTPTFEGIISGVTKTSVGLENVDNTSDQNKPISILAQELFTTKVNTVNHNTDINALYTQLALNIQQLQTAIQQALDVLEASFATNLNQNALQLQANIDTKQTIILNDSLTIAKTSGLQAALDGKQSSLTNPSFYDPTSSIQTQLNSKQETITNGGLTIAKTNGLQAILDTKLESILDNSLTIAKTFGLQEALNAKIESIADNALTISKTYGLQDTLNEKQHVLTNSSFYDPTSSIQTQLDAKQVLLTEGSLTIATTSGLQTVLDTKISTITDGSLTIAKTSGLQIALDEKQSSLLNASFYDPTSSIQTQLNSKLSTITDGSLTIAKTTGLQSALDSKISSIADDSLTIAKTSGLQIALDGKQSVLLNPSFYDPTSSIQTQLNSKLSTITDGSLTIAKTTGLQAALDSKISSIPDGSLTIAKTSGLQTALDDKQHVLTNASFYDPTSSIQTQLNTKLSSITDGSLTIAKTTGLQTALDSKISSITDGSLTIAKTSGLQTALDSKLESIGTIADGTFTIAKTSGLQSALNAKQDTLSNAANLAYVDINSLLSTTLNSKASVSMISNIDNTSDANKPISSATQTALNGKQASLVNPSFYDPTSSIQTQLNTKLSTIADDSLTIAKTTGLQTALDSKIGPIVDGGLTIAKTSGLQTALNSIGRFTLGTVMIVTGNITLTSADVNKLHIYTTNGTTTRNLTLPLSSTCVVGDLINIVWKNDGAGAASLNLLYTSPDTSGFGQSALTNAQTSGSAAGSNLKFYCCPVQGYWVRMS